MILYHFTCHEWLEQILSEGLSKGDVPTSQTEGTNAVWFTTLSGPKGHGLDEGILLSDEERMAYFNWKGVMPPEGARSPDKEAVRVTVVISETDRKLKPWWKWGRKHCDPAFFEALNSEVVPVSETGG